MSWGAIVVGGAGMIYGAVQGEKNRSWKKFHAHWMDVLLADESFTDGIPSNQKDFTDLVIKRSDYKTAKQLFDERKASKG